MNVDTAQTKLKVKFFRPSATRSWQDFGDKITHWLDGAAVNVVAVNQSLMDGELIISVWYEEPYMRHDSDSSLEKGRLKQWLL